MIFHHGGRIGDLLYSLYTVKALGGGSMYISDRQVGNWSPEIIMSLLTFVQYQEYINKAYYIESVFGTRCNYNLVDAEQDKNPQDFPEWVGPHWPGNVHIAKRYAHHFGVEWIPGSTWLTAPKTKKLDVAFHAPMRRTVDAGVLAQVVNRLTTKGKKVVVLGGVDDIDEWRPFIYKAEFVSPHDYLETADYINSAKVFLGAASSGHVCAEGLGKPRLIQQADGCDNTNPTHIINGWDLSKIMQTLDLYL